MKAFKRHVACFLCGLLMCGLSTQLVYASSLDEALNQQNAVEQQAPVEQPTTETPSTETQAPESQGSQGLTAEEVQQNTDNFIGGLHDAAVNPASQTEEVSGVTAGISKVTSAVIVVLSYGITCFLAVRIMLDLIFILIPPTRTMLSGGKVGVAGQPGGQPGMGGMGGMGMGAGMGGYGNRYGGGYGAGMGGMGMGGMHGMQGQGQPAVGTTWVSNSAINAVAGEDVVGPNGKPTSALKTYAKSMVVELVVVPILVVLAATGVLFDVGLMIAGAIAQGIGSMSTLM